MEENREQGRMIATAIKTGAGMVMAFDEAGRELPEIQGPYHLVRSRVIERASGATTFKHWFGIAAAPVVVRREEW
jgi:hypothetical protein